MRVEIEPEPGTKAYTRMLIEEDIADKRHQLVGQLARFSAHAEAVTDLLRHIERRVEELRALER